MSTLPTPLRNCNYRRIRFVTSLCSVVTLTFGSRRRASSARPTTAKAKIVCLLPERLCENYLVRANSDVLRAGSTPGSGPMHEVDFRRQTRMADQTKENALPLNISTRLAFDRTRLAHDRTMMAWVRTSTTLITPGFRSSGFSKVVFRR